MNYKSDWNWNSDGDGPGVWWARKAPRVFHDEHLDGDQDGFGAFRGAFNAFVITVALFGVIFVAGEITGALSVNAKVGLAALFMAALCCWRALHLFKSWRDWRHYGVWAAILFTAFAWSLIAWGW